MVIGSASPRRLRSTAMLLLSLCLLSTPAPALAACATVAAQAADWLTDTAQNANGSWGYEEGIRPLATTEAVLALRAYAQRGWGYYQGVTWLENHDMPNVDYRARRVIALLPHGDDVSLDVAALGYALSLDPASPGWGLSRDYTPSPLDSALAAQATALIDPASPGLLEAVSALNDLESGGWPRISGGSADLPGTALVLRAFASLAGSFPVATSSGASAALVLASASYAVESDLTRALAALALLRWSPASSSADSLLSTLELDQAADGSWGQDPYTTAIVLHACAVKLGTDDPAQQAPVTIFDYGLRKAINLALGKATTADVVTRAEIQSLTTLDLASDRVLDLSGLEEAINLTTLTLSVNTSPDESPLSVIPGLVVVRPTQSYGQVLGVQASDGISSGYVEVSWIPVTGATYGIYRTLGVGPAKLMADQIEVDSYWDETAIPGLLYRYHVTADAHGYPPVLGPPSDPDVGHRRLAAPEVVVSELIGATGDGLTPLAGVRDLAVGADGTVYVAADSGVFSIDRDGTIVDMVATAAGSLASLDGPAGIAVDRLGFVYLTSSQSNEVFEIDTTTGNALLLLDGIGDGTSPLIEPTDLAVGTAGDVFVAGASSNNVFRITPGGMVTEIIDATGDGSTPLLNPRGLAVLADDAVYVSGFGAGSWAVFRIDSSGVIARVLDTTGDGSGESPLQSPLGLAVDSRSARLVVGGYDSDNVYQVTGAGVIERLLDPALTGAGLLAVSSVAVDHRGSTLVAGEGSDNVYRMKRSGVFEVLIDSSGDGASPLTRPTALAVDAGGNVYVGDDDSVFRVATGAVQIADATGDGTIGLRCPSAVTMAQSGEIFTAGRDSDNVFRVTLDGQVSEVVTPLGDGSNSLFAPEALAMGDDGSLFVAGSQSDNVLRRAPWGQVTEIVNAAAGLGEPVGLYSAQGSLWVAGRASDNVLRVVPGSSPVEVIDSAGNGIDSLASPSALVGGGGDVFVAGAMSDNVFRISTDGALLEQVIGPAGEGSEPLDGPVALALGSEALYVAGGLSDNVLAYDRLDGSIDIVMTSAGDGVTPLVGPESLSLDGAGNLYVAASSDVVFRVDSAGEVERVFDFSGDGLHPATGPHALAASAVSDDFVVANCGSDDVHASIPVPEPSVWLSLPVLLLFLAGVLRLRERRELRRLQSKGNPAMRSMLLLFFLSVSLVWSSAPSAEPSSRREALAGDQLELSRMVSRHLFAVQRQERAASDTPALRELIAELHGLHGTLEPELVLQAGGEIKIPGQPAGSSSAVEREALVQRRLDARSARRARTRAQATRIRVKADALEAEIASLPTPRLRGQVQGALRKARRLSDEVMELDEMSGPERRRRAAVLRKRLRPDQSAVAHSSPTRDGDPTFRSITTHRKSWGTRP